MLSSEHAGVMVFQWERTVSSFSHTPTFTRTLPGGLGHDLQPGGGKLKISPFPLPGTGNTVIEAVKVLVEHGVQPSVIILLSLFSTPHGELWGRGGQSSGHRHGEHRQQQRRSAQGRGCWGFWAELPEVGVKRDLSGVGSGAGEQEGKGPVTPQVAKDSQAQELAALPGPKRFSS